MGLEIRFDTYYPYDALTERLNFLVSEHPDLLKIESIGKSYEGRDVWCVTATRFETGADMDKPAFWCDANIHATEVSPASAMLYLLVKLVNEYGKVDDVTRLLDTRVLYIVPRVNPDGAEQYFLPKPKLLRSSTRPYPYDEEALEGLQVQDIDGDGRMLQMRVPDPNGPWKSYENDGRLMIRRDPTETGGAYFRVLPEGMIENYDGVTIKMRPNKERLDLNRNFPAEWRQENEQFGAGPYPGSEPEVQNLLRFIAAHPNITGAISFHTHSGVLLRPYGTKDDESLPAEDLWTYKKIGDKGTALTGYPNASVYHDFKYHPKEVITGVFDDWMYDHLGVFAWTCEIWAPQVHAGIKDRKFIEWYREHPLDEDLKMLAWSDTELEGKGHVEWYPYNHPQLGAVEIGGWDYLYAFRNPPPKYLEAEIAPLASWVIWHALISPQLALTEASATDLGDGNFLVRVVVDNTGWLPTYITKKAIEKKAVREIVGEITLPDGAILRAGKTRVELGQLEGRAYKSTSPYAGAADTTDHRVKLEWVVSAPNGGTVQIVVRHERAGKLSVSRDLVQESKDAS